MCCPTSCHPGPSLWHSEHAYRGLPQGKLLPPKHEAMFSPKPRGSGKVWMMLTSEYTLIIIYYVNQIWVIRKGFWWRFQKGKIQPMSMCIRWDVDEKPCTQLQNGPYLRFLKGQTRLSLATSVSIGRGQSRPHFKEWFIVDAGLSQKLRGLKKLIM